MEHLQRYKHTGEQAVSVYIDYKLLWVRFLITNRPPDALLQVHVFLRVFWRFLYTVLFHSAPPHVWGELKWMLNVWFWHAHAPARPRRGRIHGAVTLADIKLRSSIPHWQNPAVLLASTLLTDGPSSSTVARARAHASSSGGRAPPSGERRARTRRRGRDQDSSLGLDRDKGAIGRLKLRRIQGFLSFVCRLIPLFLIHVPSWDEKIITCGAAADNGLKLQRGLVRCAFTHKFLHVCLFHSCLPCSSSSIIYFSKSIMCSYGNLNFHGIRFWLNSSNEIPQTPFFVHSGFFHLSF